MSGKPWNRANRKVLGNQKGFTLIEIIIVMVLLGILAATVAPKFLDLRTEARTAAVDGMAGGLKSAGSIVYTACMISTACDETKAGGDAAAHIVVGGTDILVSYGWPTVATIETAAGVTLGNFTASTSGTTRTFLLQTGCKVDYVEATGAGVNATVTPTTTGC